jgi:hypothetical protein
VQVKLLLALSANELDLGGVSTACQEVRSAVVLQKRERKKKTSIQPNSFRVMLHDDTHIKHIESVQLQLSIQSVQGIPHHYTLEFSLRNPSSHITVLKGSTNNLCQDY